MIRSTAARNIILGTSSSTRKAIASEMGFKFDIVKADIDERALGDRSSSAGARDLVLLLAKKKAQAILAKLTAEQKASSKILLTADQVVTYKGKILEKPTNKEEVRSNEFSFIETRGFVDSSASLYNIYYIYIYISFGMGIYRNDNERCCRLK